ncbi:hypothetical protein MAA_11622 [Metarhizium robertsii ARSEF 23]|uniref:Rhodopsin domain-containing protein n=1 Tax=Metarhizium robertsii (strain ARSEF 23 / ATCC MYA-3075) TaxID=655844 RepID=A0A0B2XFR7_METRA|nr:uncharacterized protein MAA_11622 [Metarhizium robertsii ARSEF 23]KHO10776.1 hypothetical protein MAA_11622 [Metarhizium robertsii ARSEF 23]
MASAGLPPPPSGIDLSQDKRPLIVAISVTTWILAFTTVACRIVGRRMRGLQLWLDDWFIVAALPPSLGHVLGMAAYAVSHGLGRHVWAAKRDCLYAWALGLFVAEICYTLTLVFVELSILSFFWRSFSVRDSIQWPILILASIVCIWGAAVLLVTFLQCLPTRAIWERFDPANSMSANNYTCEVDPVKFFYANAIPTIVTDLVMLMLPVPYVWRLQLPRIQKIALGCVFLAGVFVTIISMIRFYHLLSLDLEDPDITWNFVTVGIWSFVEGNTAIVCACLPFLRPVMNRIPCGNPFILAPVPLNIVQQSEDSGRGFNQKNVFPSWGFNTSHAASTTPVQSLHHDELDNDEQPFAHLSDDVSETDTPARRVDGAFADLEAVVATPSARYIPMTRDVCQPHQATP